ncbi:hypothetical protein HYW46_01675 [Candidatus Daviesbacteria bacterium]|nr:hypothetical protein [Candidatus Daviesbacteria bacterium]
MFVGLILKYEEIPLGFDPNYGDLEVIMRFFNTAFSLSMVVPPFSLKGGELTAEQVGQWLREGDVQNVANPSHANTLAAVSQRLGVDVRNAAGGRVVLNPGDQVLVAQVTFPPSVPRETTEYSDEQLALGKFSFVLVEIA